MRKNKQSNRSLTAFLVTWAFLVLTLTGLLLYIVPQGRVAYWIHWSFLGMEKEQWSWVHMMFGGVFIVTGFLHLYFNWKPFKKYFADRVKGRFVPKQEIFIASTITLLIFVVSAMNIPPASWVIDLNSWIKDRWVTSPELEPPFGHAEESTLSGLSRKMQLDLGKVLMELDNRGIRFSGKQDTLEHIARVNNTTPMLIYGMFQQHRLQQSQQQKKPQNAEDIEARYSGTGLGRKTIAEVCEETGINLDNALQRLSQAGVPAKSENKMRVLADQHDKTPINLLTIMMLE